MSTDPSSGGRIRYLIGWSVCLLGMLVLLFFQLRKGPRLETSVLNLMPRAEQDPVFETIRNSFQGTMGKTLVILLEADAGTGTSPSSVEQSEEIVLREMKKSKAFADVRSTRTSTDRSFYDLYFPYRFQIFAPSTRKKLSSEHPLRKLREKIVRKLHSQELPMYTDLLQKDPLLLFPALLESWSRIDPSSSEIKQKKVGKHRRIVVARLHGNPMNRETQNRVSSVLEQCRNEIRDSSDRVDLRWTGLVRFAMASRKDMRNDMTLIGMVSLIGVVLLVLSVFRSLKQLLLLVSTILVGFLTAFSVSQLFFSLHVITVVFGATLIGISVDYAFHYFAEYHLRDEDWTSRQGLKNIFPGLFMGWITSTIAFGGLALTPFPALQQIALFTALGLTGSFLTVVICYPFVFRNQERVNRKNLFLSMTDALVWPWENFREGNLSKMVPAITGAGVLLVLVFGLSTVSFSDRLEDFAQTPESLKENDRYIRKTAGIRDTGRYIFIQSPDRQKLLERQERIRNVLDDLVQKDNAFQNFLSLETFLPSKEKQKENRALLRNLVMSRTDAFRSMLQKVGYKQKIINQLIRTLKKPLDEISYLEPEEWLNHPVSFGIRQLWLGSDNGTYSSLIVLEGVRNEKLIQERIEEFSWAHYRNRPRTFRNLIREYRWLAMKLTGAAYLLVALLLLLRYGPLRGLLTMIPAVGGSAITVSLLSLLGYTMNLMNILALLIILGMGIDYAVFLSEAINRGKGIRSSMLALLLSAMTTVISFGCLAFSQAPVISSLGITVCPGILIILFLSPVVCTGKR